MKKKKDERKRARKLIEFPAESHQVWHRARVAALEQKVTIGQFLIESLRLRLDREAPLSR